MSTSLDQVRDLALALKPPERSQLVESLLLSLDPSVSDTIEREWLETAQRRLEELNSGRVSGIPADQVFERLRSRNASA
jgi:putative addiction module component (TIGR02574 family)